MPFAIIKVDCFCGGVHVMQPSHSLLFINPQPMSGLFEISVPIFADDVVRKVAARVARKVHRPKGKQSCTYHSSVHTVNLIAGNIWNIPLNSMFY